MLDNIFQLPRNRCTLLDQWLMLQPQRICRVSQ